MKSNMVDTLIVTSNENQFISHMPFGMCERIILFDQRIKDHLISLTADSVIGNLKDKDGMPYYRILNPLGQIIDIFEDIDKQAYNQIISQLKTIIEDVWDFDKKTISNLKEKNKCLVLPQKYVDWLQTHSNHYFNVIGENLQYNSNKVFLDIEEIINVVLDNCLKLISDYISSHKGIGYIIFYSVKPLMIAQKVQNDNPQIKVMNLPQWRNLIKYDHKVFKIGPITLGRSLPEGLGKPIDGEITFKGATIIVKDNICCVMKATDGTGAFRDLLNCIFRGEFGPMIHSKNNIMEFTKKYGFKQGFYNCLSDQHFSSSKISAFFQYPHISFDYYEEIVKKTDTFICTISFKQQKGNALPSNLSIQNDDNLLNFIRIKPYTIHEIKVELKTK